MWANFQRITELFTQKIVTKLSTIWVWDPRSEIRDPRSETRDPGYEIRKKPIPDRGFRGQQGTGSRIRNTGSQDRIFSSLLAQTSLCAAHAPFDQRHFQVQHRPLKCRHVLVQFRSLQCRKVQEQLSRYVQVQLKPL